MRGAPRWLAAGLAMLAIAALLRAFTLTARLLLLR